MRAARSPASGARRRADPPRARNAALVERQRARGARARAARELGHVVVDARDRDHAAVVDEPREQAHERASRRRAPARPTCRCGAGDRARARATSTMHEPAQAGRERRNARRRGSRCRRARSRRRAAARGARAGTPRGAREPISSSPSTTQLHVHGQRARGLEPGAQRGEVEHQARLVVDDAAPVEAAVAARVGSNGGDRQCSGAPGRLHVVVRVDEHRRRAGPAASHSPTRVRVRAGQRRISTRSRPRLREQLGRRLRRCAPPARVEARRRHARDAREVAEVVEGALEAGLEGAERGVGPHGREAIARPPSFARPGQTRCLRWFARLRRVEPRSRLVTGANGAELHVLEWSDEGVPLLLLHGFGNEAHIWDDFAPVVAPHYRTLALDHRGHGDSDWDPEGRYDYDSTSTTSSRVTAALGIERLVLVGHSLGGRIATLLRRRHPERLAGLVIVDIGARARRARHRADPPGRRADAAAATRSFASERSTRACSRSPTPPARARSAARAWRTTACAGAPTAASSRRSIPRWFTASPRRASDRARCAEREERARRSEHVGCARDACPAPRSSCAAPPPTSSRPTSRIAWWTRCCRTAGSRSSRAPATR